MSIKGVVAVLLILFMYGIAGQMDYQDYQQTTNRSQQ